MKTNSQHSGTVFEIERFAINDGPGIRSIVFLKGCPLSCKWCANPESQKKSAQLMYWITRCIGCKNCIKTCSNNALTWNGNNIEVDREKCKACGACADICNSEALTAIGRVMTVDDVMNVISRDEKFYTESGGGITFSGGEVFLQDIFLKELAAACKEKGYHTCIETSGYTTWDKIASVLDNIDLFLFDFKCMDDEKHHAFVGSSNQQILHNYRQLVKYGKKVVARVPVIPEVNNNMENFELLSSFLQTNNPGCRIDLLPYHRLGVTKYDRLDIDYDLVDIVPPSNEEMEQYQNYLIQKGFDVTIGG